MKELLEYIIDRIVGYEQEEEKEEQKYIIDLGNQSYGVIVSVGNRKEMYKVSSNPPGLAQPNEYTFDEITATQFSDFSKLKKV